MRSAIIALLCLLALAWPVNAEQEAAPGAASEATPEAVLAWFTGADVPNSVRLEAPEDALPTVPGTSGSGVALTHAVALDCPILKQSHGMIGFWIRPEWNGNDGKNHRILRIGDPEKNGLLIEKSDLGMLRFVMASPKKVSASRADVSGWKKGEWHHVVVVWLDFESKPLGMPIWIDKKIATGPITADNSFLDPSMMEDNRVWIGDESSDAVMDELIIRSTLSTKISKRPLHVVYRDYFLTAPYGAIRIDPEPLGAPADRRVVEGQPKQFGLEARIAGKFVDITDYVAFYENWSVFDAKPFITWRTSDPNVATVDKDGLVTGVRVGKCTLTAEFRGMNAEYKIDVISSRRPDLDLTYVEQLPRYDRRHRKVSPDVGETVQSVAHIVNMGYEPVPKGIEVTFELMRETNGDYELNPAEERSLIVQKQRLPWMAIKEEVVFTFQWEWPEYPVWVRVTVDPSDRVDEICEANNHLCALNTARAVRWAYEPDEVNKIHNEKQMLSTGSFSVFDWDQSHIARLNKMVREAIYPSTTPHGIDMSVRLDYIPWRGDYLAGDPWGPYKDRTPEDKHNEFLWDGGWPHDPIRCPLSLDSALMHELGHTMLALPDLYGAPIDANRCYLTDDNGQPYEGGELLPYIAKHHILPRPSVAGFTPCGEGYPSLMDYCSFWIEESNAVKMQHYAKTCPQPFWGSQGPLVPTLRNSLYVTDINDQPLVGAAIYVYQIAQGDNGCQGAQYFYERPKFVGNVDHEGRFIFPDKTDKDWDDPDTDVCEGEMVISNPFGRALRPNAFTPHCFGYDGLFLIKIVSGNQAEFQYLTLSDMMIAFAKNKVEGEYPIRTSLQPSNGETSVIRWSVPEAIREKNLRPVAVVDQKELTVKCGEEFTIDALSGSDPEGQPLVVRAWQVREGDIRPGAAVGMTFKGTASKEPGDAVVVFYVNDGLRTSEAVPITIHIVKPDSE